MKFTVKPKKDGVDQEPISVDIPNAWHLVTWRQFVALSKAGSDQCKIIEAVTGIDSETIRAASIKNFDVLISCLSFMTTEMNLIMPSTILGYKVPTNLEDEAAARFGDVQEIAQKFKEDDKIGNLEYYPLIAATYIVPSPYNFKEADKLAERLQDAPCSEVMAIGNFTLLKLMKSSSGMLNSSHLEGTLRNRLRRATINWLQRLAFRIRYATWKRSLRSRG